MNALTSGVDRLEHAVVRRMAPYRDELVRASIDALRISLGLVFVLFGALKFVPGLSPAEGMATRTMELLTFGLIPDGVGIIIVAAMETVIGLCLLTGRNLRLGLGLLGVAMVGVLSPLVLLTGELFSGPNNAPALAAQYVLKDIVLLAAGVVITTYGLLRHPAVTSEMRSEAKGGDVPVSIHSTSGQKGNTGPPAPRRSAA